MSMETGIALAVVCACLFLVFQWWFWLGLFLIASIGGYLAAIVLLFQLEILSAIGMAIVGAVGSIAVHLILDVQRRRL